MRGPLQLHYRSDRLQLIYQIDPVQPELIDLKHSLLSQIKFQKWNTKSQYPYD